MTSGIKITDIEIGSGPVAERPKTALVHVRGFLNRGEEFWNTYNSGQPAVLDLRKRHSIPGLINGIEGMRAGGKRKLVVSPHLAYGPAGIPGKVPPNAVIHYVVELLAVRDPEGRFPELTLPGKRLLVCHPGEQARNLARWQFCVRDVETVAGVAITPPVAGATWRHARTKNFEVKLTDGQVQEVVESVQSTFAAHPKECLRNEQMWADSSEKANSITREQVTNTLCITVYLYERESLLLAYGLPENSPVLRNSLFYQHIMSAVEPHLTTLDNELKASNAAKQRDGGCRLP